MGSFFVKLRGNASSNPAVIVSAQKRDHGSSVMTPLEKMLQNSGPLRSDGSDKFFGMENYGNTCYCNSILQCLYYSVPFRESVINYPKRSPIEVLNAVLANNLRYPNADAQSEGDGQVLPRQRTVGGNPSSRSAGVPPNQPQKVEDKDSPEYKKRVAMNTLPLLETTDNAASYGMKESLFTSLKDIFEAVVASQSRMGIIRPYQFLEVLRREHEMFRTAMHQDAHEFLNLLLNEVVANVEAESKRIPLDTDDQSEGGDLSEQATTTVTTTESVSTTLIASNGTKSPNTTRWVHELFEGTLTSETQCLTCENVSQRDEVFLDLSVDLDQHSSVTSCLRKFSEEEMLCERNKFHCDNCGGLQEAEKRMKIKRLPRILALHLKRFKYTEDLQRLQKLFHRVVYPYYLRLFNTTDDAEDPDRLYELYAVVVHIGGGPYHGHYVAIIKTEDRGWLLFDDEMVEPVDTNYVRNFFGDRPGLACAYVLFYQETTFEAMQREQEQEGVPPVRQPSDVKDPTGSAHKMNGSPTTPDVNRVRSGLPGSVSLNSPQFPSLKASPTTPELFAHPENALSMSLPSATSASAHPSGAMAAPKSDTVQSKKERAKEEKERKAAEKQKRKGEEAKVKEEHKRREAESKATLEAVKASKVEEDRGADSTVRNTKENGIHVGFSGSLSRFKLVSKSLNHHHRPFSKDKDRESKIPDLPPLPGQEASNDGFLHEQHHGQEERQGHAAEEGRKNATPAVHEEEYIQALPLAEQRHENQEQSEKPVKQATPKRSRFSLRKKSFNVL